MTVALLVALCTAACTQKAAAPNAALQRPALRVCSDPNNLPFSDIHGAGFENRIAELVAHDLGEQVRYTWWAQHRGYVRNTLKAGDCDVLIGVPANFEMALPTTPYYRSTYVFVSRRDRHLGITSFDDPRLHKLKIGVQIIGNDHVNTPPVHALGARGVISNIVGYPVYGDYTQPSPTRNIVDAVARGDVDLAVVWGPQAGFFAKSEPVPLDLVPVSPQIDTPFLPFVFDISMGVRRGDNALREKLERVLDRRRPDIERILDQYGVPRV